MLEKAINGIRNSSILDTEQETLTSVVAFINLVIYKRSWCKYNPF